MTILLDGVHRSRKIVRLFRWSRWPPVRLTEWWGGLVRWGAGSVLPSDRFLQVLNLYVPTSAGFFELEDLWLDFLVCLDS